MRTEWTKAAADKAPVVAYLCYRWQMPVFKDNRVVMHKPMTEALPYTPAMLDRRAERGPSVPVWWRHVDTFAVGEAA